ncbi:hypothetical protein D3C72_1847610 [compost metagenome]
MRISAFIAVGGSIMSSARRMACFCGFQKKWLRWPLTKEASAREREASSTSRSSIQRKGAEIITLRSGLPGLGTGVSRLRRVRHMTSATGSVASPRPALT